MLARERKQSKRHSFEARRNERRKHGLGYVVTENTGGYFGAKARPAAGAGSSGAAPCGAGAVEAEVEAETQAEQAARRAQPVTWRGRYYYHKFGFRDIEGMPPGVSRGGRPGCPRAGRPTQAAACRCWGRRCRRCVPSTPKGWIGCWRTTTGPRPRRPHAPCLTSARRASHAAAGWAQLWLAGCVRAQGLSIVGLVREQRPARSAISLGPRGPCATTPLPTITPRVQLQIARLF